MAVSITVDLVENGDFQKSISPTGREIYSATRSAFVKGVTDGSDRQSATAMIRAQAAVEALYPRWSLYDPLVPLCVLQGYRNQGVPENSDAVKVLISYASMPEGGGGAAGQFTPWTITDDRDVELVETQIDPKDKGPIYFAWRSKDGKERIGPELATFHVSRTIRRIVISGVIQRDPLDSLITLEDTVNEGTFDRRPIGWWRCSGVHTETSLGSKFWKVSATFDRRSDQDWSEFEFLKYRGKYYADAASVKDLKGRPYLYGVEGPGAGGGGIVKFGPYRTANFNGVLGISRWADLYPKN